MSQFFWQGLATISNLFLAIPSSNISKNKRTRSNLDFEKPEIRKQSADSLTELNNYIEIILN